MMPCEHAEEWAAEFAESTPFQLLPDGTKEHALAVVTHFLRKSAELTEESARRALLEEMPLLDLPATARKVKGALQTPSAESRIER